MKRADGYIKRSWTKCEHPLPQASLGLLLCTALLLAACGSETPSTTEVRSQGTSPTEHTSGTPATLQETESPKSLEAITSAWSASPHASSFVLDVAGENSTCARCHAPVQWVPSMEDMPENCSTCKFEVNPPPPVIDQSEWTHVECRVCHQEKKGEIMPDVLWLEIAAIEEYAEISSHEELCQMCHLAEEIPGHTSVQVAGDHAGYDCTECHDAHTTTASCMTADCHGDVLAAERDIPAHDENHNLVRCQACHDAGGLTVGPHPETGKWTTFIPAGTASEDTQWTPFASHTTQVAVACDRCHYEANPWELSVEVKSEP